MTSFELFRNPFVLLGVDPSASPNEIAEAFEEAVTQRRYPEADLTAARQALLRPVLRLQAEISSLLDTPHGEWRAILTALRRSQSAPALREALPKVAALSRSNILAELCSRVPSDASILIAWVNAQGEIRPNFVHSDLQRFREIAGIAPPDRTAVATTLNELREQQAQALLDGFASPSDAIEGVTTCTKNVISDCNDDNITALSSLLNSYHRYIDQELSVRHDRIKITTVELQADPDGPGNLALVIDALKFWNAAAKPLQLLEVHKSRSELRSQAVFQEIRSVAIDLANNSSRFDVALSLTKACQIEFADLPRAEEQLAEDESTLKDQIAAAKIEPLANAITKLDGDLHTLAADLRNYGFGKGAVGLAKSLRDTFVAVANDSKESAANELPWLMLRSVSLKLNNDREDPDGALALVDGLLELSVEFGASNEVKARLGEDRRAAERNRLEKQFLSCLNANRHREALSAIENLIPYCKDPEERDKLQNLKSQLQRKRTGQYLRWGFWAAVVGGGIVLANMDHSPNSPSRSPSYDSQTVATSPVRNSPEEMPPIGTDRTFTEGNIRYCKFQDARLEFMKPRLITNFQIGAFNRLVDDYNSRCSSFRYRKNDWSKVQLEVTEKQAELEAQAQRIINGWSAQR
jgi:hypothetical protein